MTETALNNLSARKSTEGGQSVVFVLLGLGLFLLGSAALAVDFTNAYLHHETAQSAADAACSAGTMDMLLLANGGTVTSAHMNPPTDVTCSNTNVASPSTTNVACWYAAINGYTSAGLTANTDSNLVEVIFPSAADVAACPSGAACPAPGSSPVASSFLPSAWNTRPMLKVRITDRVRLPFMGLATGTRTLDVKAVAVCGLVAGNSPAPITVLSPSANKALEFGGGGDIVIYGGPQRGIQVNSNSSSAIFGSGGVDLFMGNAGPSNLGATVAVYGSSTACCNFTTNCAMVGGAVCTWTTGAIPASDYFKNIAVPAVPANGSSSHVNYPTSGCPDVTYGCTLYQPGHYSSQLQVKGTGGRETAIFVPGLYYLDADFDIGSNSCVRPSTDTGDGSKGVTFYFSGNKSLSMTGGDCSGGGIDVYTAKSGGTPVNNSVCITSGMGQGFLPSTLPSTFSGSVLFGPCTGTYGDPLGVNNPSGQQRGLLFFQGRGTTPNGGNAPKWTGGGQYWAVGNMYFHNSTSVDTDFSFNSASNGYFTGAIIADTFKMTGSGQLNMYLSANTAYTSLKVSPLR